MPAEDTRIDKWLWATRIFKTRSQAIEACKKGRIIINEVPVKASRLVKIGEEINVKNPPVVYTYKIKALLNNRVSAKLVNEYLENLTSEEELLKLKIKNDNFFVGQKGRGRPTKKERRVIDKLKNQNDF